MKESTHKEKVLKKIREALIHKTPLPFPQLDTVTEVYEPQKDDLEVVFAQEYTKNNGNFVFCLNEKEFIENLKALIGQKKWGVVSCFEKGLIDIFSVHNYNIINMAKDQSVTDAGITLCEALIARTGSVLLSTAQESGRVLPVYPPAHITVAYTDQIVYDLKEAIKNIQLKYQENMPSMINLASGPSRTADIEKTLVLGAHGPKEVYVFLIENRS